MALTRDRDRWKGVRLFSDETLARLEATKLRNEASGAYFYGMEYVIAGRMLRLTAPLATELWLTAERTGHTDDYNNRETLRRVRDYLAGLRRIK